MTGRIFTPWVDDMPGPAEIARWNLEATQAQQQELRRRLALGKQAAEAARREQAAAKRAVEAHSAEAQADIEKQIAALFAEPDSARAWLEERNLRNQENSK